MRFTSDQMREANAVRGVLERLPAEGTESPHRFTVTFPASFWSSGLQEVIELETPADLMALAVAAGLIEELGQLPDEISRQQFTLGVANSIEEKESPIPRGLLMVALLMVRGFGVGEAEEPHPGDATHS